jgi:hypothetical protein
VKVGLKLFHELGERTKRLEGEVDLYRGTLVDIAKQHHVEVPASLMEDAAGLGEEEQIQRASQIRQWLAKVLAVPLGTEEVSAGGRRRVKATGKSETGRSRSTREKGGTSVAE